MCERPPARLPPTAMTCRGWAPPAHSLPTTMSRDRLVCAASSVPAAHGDDVLGIGALGELSTGDDEPDHRVCAASGVPAARDDEVQGPSTMHGPWRTLLCPACRQHQRVGIRRHASFDSAPSRAPPLLPTPSVAPGRGSAASQGLLRCCLGPWRRHGLAGTWRHGPFDAPAAARRSMSRLSSS